MAAVVPSYCYKALLGEYLAKGDKLLALDETNRRFIILSATAKLPPGCTTNLSLISKAVASLRELFSGLDYLEAIKPKEALALLGNLRWLQRRQRAHNQAVQARCCRISSLVCIPLCCIPCCSPNIRSQEIDNRALLQLTRRTKISTTWPRLFDLPYLMQLFSGDCFLIQQFPEIASTVLGQALVSEHRKEFREHWEEEWLIIANQLTQMELPETRKRSDRLVVFPAFFQEHTHVLFFWDCLQHIQATPGLTDKTAYVVPKLLHNAIQELENAGRSLRPRGISMIHPLKCHRSIVCASLNNWSQTEWLNTVLSLFGFQIKQSENFLQACTIIKLYKQYKPILQLEFVELASYQNLEEALDPSLKTFSLLVYSYYTDPIEQICLLVLREMNRWIPPTAAGYDKFIALNLSYVKVEKKLTITATSSVPSYHEHFDITVSSPTL